MVGLAERRNYGRLAPRSVWNFESAQDGLVLRSPNGTNEAQEVGGPGGKLFSGTTLGNAAGGYSVISAGQPDSMTAYASPPPIGFAGSIGMLAVGSTWPSYGSLVQGTIGLGLPGIVASVSAVKNLVNLFAMNSKDDIVTLQVGSNTTNAETETEAPTYLDWAVKTVTDFSIAAERLSGAASEALHFLAKLSAESARPTIWTDSETEIVFEWINGPKHAVVSFEGDGEFGYALKADGRFVPGAFRGDPRGSLPADLSEYINAT